MMSLMRRAPLTPLLLTFPLPLPLPLLLLLGKGRTASMFQRPNPAEEEIEVG